MIKHQQLDVEDSLLIHKQVPRSGDYEKPEVPTKIKVREPSQLNRVYEAAS